MLQWRLWFCWKKVSRMHIFTFHRGLYPPSPAGSTLRWKATCRNKSSPFSSMKVPNIIDMGYIRPKKAQGFAHHRHGSHLINRPSIRESENPRFRDSENPRIRESENPQHYRSDRNIPEATATFHKLPEHSTSYRNIPEATTTFQKSLCLCM